MLWSCGSGLGQIRIFFPDPHPDRLPGHADPDRYYFQANGKVDKVDIIPENFNMKYKILKTYDTFDTDEKDKTL